MTRVEVLEAALARLQAACHEERQRLLQAAESAQMIGKWDAATEYRKRAKALSGALTESEEI